MKTAPEFEYLATCFYQRSDLEYDTAEEWVRGIVGNFLNPTQKLAVKNYLDDLLSKPITEEQLMSIWNSLDSDYPLGKSPGTRFLFEWIRDAASKIDKK